MTYKGIDYENLKLKYDQLVAERDKWKSVAVQKRNEIDALYIDHKKKDHVIDALKSELIAARRALEEVAKCEHHSDCDHYEIPKYMVDEALARIDKFLGEKE